jgi:hypothetical protein
MPASSTRNPWGQNSILGMIVFFSNLMEAVEISVYSFLQRLVAAFVKTSSQSGTVAITLS